MSAFVVKDETIDLIIAGLKYAAQYGGYSNPLPTPTNPALDFDSPAEFGASLRRMNVDSVLARYGDEEGNSPYHYTPIVPPSAIQLYKSIQCFLYQCNEGDKITRRRLFKALAKYATDIAVHIVNHSAAYEAAKWG